MNIKSQTILSLRFSGNAGYLIKAGVDVTVSNVKGFTARQLAGATIPSEIGGLLDEAEEKAVQLIVEAEIAAAEKASDPPPITPAT